VSKFAASAVKSKEVLMDNMIKIGIGNLGKTHILLLVWA
jgi:hypothetical protein